jgi:hypothetical protein
MPYILTCHLQTDADPVPDTAYHYDADADPDFYLMRIRMRVQVTKMIRIHITASSLLEHLNATSLTELLFWQVIVPPLNRCLLLVGVDCAAWYTDLPRPHRTLAPTLLNRYAS